MNDRIAGILNRVRNKEHHCFRKEISWDKAPDGLSQMELMTFGLKSVLSKEKPIIYNDEKIVLMRTVINLPKLFERPKKQLDVGNICPDYASVIHSGLQCVRDEADRDKNNIFFRCVVENIDAVLDLCARYADAAEERGLMEISERLKTVPIHGAKSFLDALQMFRILHFALWCEGEIHNTVGRFDQYMLKYLQNDLQSGILTEESAYELLLEFFISFNKDNDLYAGVQRGDNGQSLMLGGLTPNGEDGYNILSEMCLRASKELKLIDPKINLRVHKNTPLSVYELGTELTKIGLGFPQYSNDEIVIPALIDWGYEEQDARNYTVAACWEFIIPGLGMEIPNVEAVSFPAVIDRVLRKNENFTSFDDMLEAVKKEVALRCDEIIEDKKDIKLTPAPFISILMGCVPKGKDVSEGAKYNNFGLHGTGLATAADSLAAMRKIIWEEKALGYPAFKQHVFDDFKDAPELLSRLRYEMPKMGQNNDEADNLASTLLDTFAAALKGKKNGFGGIYRAGTGSAMFYLWHSEQIGASPDGRRAGEMFPANYAPSLFAKIDGPISVVQSFTKPNLRAVANGGPLTMEFHEDLFKDPDSIRKIAMLVKSFIDRGGHQMQLNTVNRETLLSAQKNPGDYQNLIVRVWGWSAYFVELDKEYQNHVISRQEYIN